MGDDKFIKIGKAIIFVLGILLIIMQVVHLKGGVDIYVLIIFMILASPMLVNYLQKLKIFGAELQFRERDKVLKKETIEILNEKRDFIKEKIPLRNSEEFEIKLFLDDMQEGEVEGVISFFQWLNSEPRRYIEKKIYYFPLQGKPYFLTSINFKDVPEQFRKNVKLKIRMETFTKEAHGPLFQFNKNMVQLSEIGKKILERLEQLNNS